jgi:hypothetical protein
MKKRSAKEAEKEKRELKRKEENNKKSKYVEYLDSLEKMHARTEISDETIKDLFKDDVSYYERGHLLQLYFDRSLEKNNFKEVKLLYQELISHWGVDPDSKLPYVRKNVFGGYVPSASRLFNIIIINNNVEMFAWIYSLKGENLRLTKSNIFMAAKMAAATGKMDIMNIIRKRINDRWICHAVFKNCTFTLISWMREHGVKMHLNLNDYAAERGDIETLNWSVDNFPLTTNACAMAAKGGNLECLKILRSKRCPWNIRTCILAAEYGHLDVLKWARENKCPWNKNVLSIAFKNEHSHVVEWASLPSSNCSKPKEWCYRKKRMIAGHSSCFNH